MPSIDTNLLASVVNALNIAAWVFPLILLTAIAYYIEKYTKFKTKWKLLLASTTLTLLQTMLAPYGYHESGINPTHVSIANTLLLASMILGVYAYFKLLEFQKINIGKTKDVVEILGTIGVSIPALAYLGGRITLTNAWSLAAYNISITLLSLVFLMIGKTIRNYIPKHGNKAYLTVIAASMLLPVNMLLQSYTHISEMSLEYKNTLTLLGVFFQSAGNLLLMLAALILIGEARIRGIHLTPTATGEMEKTPLRYRLKKGYSYLISEFDSKKAFEIFNDYAAHKHKGLGIIRTNPEIVRREYALRTTPLLWMTTAETEIKSIKPKDLERLLLIIKDFISNGGNLILVERLDYLITENGFKNALNFIHRLNDTIVQSECIMVVSINLNTLNQEEKAQLTQEFQNLEEMDSIVLSEPLYEVLDYINNENKNGKRPSFKRVTEKFSITKTTTRSRIQDLENKKLLRVIDDGKFKLLEITDRGKELMKSPVGPRGW